MLSKENIKTILDINFYKSIEDTFGINVKENTFKGEKCEDICQDDITGIALFYLDKENKINLRSSEENVYKYSDLENYSRVGDIMNYFDCTSDAEERFNIATKIISDWINFVDIQDYEEEGYLITYTQRKLRELGNASIA